MTKKLFIFIFAFSSTLFGQTSSDKIVVKKQSDSKANPDITDNMYQSASYPGGMTPLWQFVEKNIKYPEKARIAELQGTVIINFMVEKDGSLTELKVSKEIKGCPECGEEAIRVIKLMPKWLPAIDRNKKIRSPYVLPIRFKIEVKLNADK